MMQLPAAWKTKIAPRRSLDKVLALTELWSPVNRSFRNDKLGYEAFWPSSLNGESHKAASILNSFCSRSDHCAPSECARIGESELSLISVETGRGWLL